jgi:glucose/arabinose dehydrogenase
LSWGSPQAWQTAAIACAVACGGDATWLANADVASDPSAPPAPEGATTASFYLEEIPWALAPDFRIERVATGFELPVAIAFVPDPGPSENAPLLYVVEQLGTIRTVRRNGVVSTYAAGLLNFDPAGSVPGTESQGLSGAAVDPSNGDLYVTLAFRPDPGTPGTANYVGVDRLTSTDGGSSAATRTRVFSIPPGDPDLPPQIGKPSFGPDGYLYVPVGNGTDAATSQQLNDFHGKILRMTTSGGAVSRNPYYDIANSITPRDYVFAAGLNDPIAGAWRLSDERHYFVERGPNEDRFARLAVGRNYGYSGSDASMRNFALYNWSPASLPTDIAFVQAETFDGSGFPAEYAGRAYVTQMGYPLESGAGDTESKVITEWVIDGRDSLVDGARAIAVYDGEGVATASAIAAGPDGIYFADLYSDDPAGGPSSAGASVYRLSYTEPSSPADCNGNGVADEDDLALGDDCNHNGVPDECDIAALRSIDCNSNGSPDECEVASIESFQFTYGSQGFRLGGSTEWVSGAIRLTPAIGGFGSAILSPYAAPLSKLRAEFDFKIGGGTGADGMSFVVFDAARYTDSELFGEDGLGLGALVLKLNTFDNGDGFNNVQVLLDGRLIGSYSPTFSLRDGLPHTVRVFLDEGRLSVSLTGGSGDAEAAFEDLVLPGYVPFIPRIGFGARTGGLTDEHQIDNVVLWAPSEADRNFSGVVDTCECVADLDDGSGWGVPDGSVNVDDLSYFIDDYLNGGSAADVDDGSDTGTPDGAVNEADLQFFLEHLYEGC